MTATERAPTVAGLILRGNAAAATISAPRRRLPAAWFVPALAILVVWPLLFVVPGWVLVAWLRPGIAATGRLGLAVVLSVAVSAHLVYWLSALGGYRRETIFLAAALLMTPLVAAAAGRLGHLRRPAARRTKGGPAQRRGLRGCGAGGVRRAGPGQRVWHPTDTGVSAGGSNWSDLGVTCRSPSR